MEHNQEGQGPIAKGWWPDPRKPQELERYFDGSSWTSDTRAPRPRTPSFAPAKADPAPVTLAPKAPEMAPTADGTIPMFAPPKKKAAKKKPGKAAPPRKNEAPPPPKQAPPLFAGDWAAPIEEVPEKGAEKSPTPPKQAPVPPPAFSPPPNSPKVDAPAAPTPPAPPAPPTKGFAGGSPSDPPTAPIPVVQAPKLDGSAPPPPPAPPGGGSSSSGKPSRPMPTTRARKEEVKSTSPFSWLNRFRRDEEEIVWLGVIAVALIAVASGLFLTPMPAKTTQPGGAPAQAEVAGAEACGGFVDLLHPGPVTPELYDALVAATQQPEPPDGLQEAAAAAVSTNTTDPLLTYCGLQ